MKVARGCDDCGWTAWARGLDWDHVRGQKVATVANLIRTGRPWSDVELETEKCDLVCANCHRIRTLERLARIAVTAEQARQGEVTSVRHFTARLPEITTVASFRAKPGEGFDGQRGGSGVGIFLAKVFADTPHYVRDAHWIIVERDLEGGERDLLVGPYRDEAAAHDAISDSLLLDSLAEESCFDMFAVSHAVAAEMELADAEVVLIDPQEPMHHGRARSVECPACDGDGLPPSVGIAPAAGRCGSCRGSGRAMPT